MMQRRNLLLPAVVLGMVCVSVGTSSAGPPNDDAAVEALAQSAFDKWANSQGVSLIEGTVACTVDSATSTTVHCYAQAAPGIVAAMSPIPTDGRWQFALAPGSIVIGPTVTPPSPTTVPPTPATTSPVAVPAITDGIYAVNVDISPGRYQSDSSEPCYWARLSALSDDVEDIIANRVSEGLSVADIEPTDIGFESSGCGQWRPYLPPAAPATEFGSGDFVVGSDIEPGIYSTEGGEGCAWRRVSSFTADSDDIIAIELPEGRTEVEIMASDVGFLSDRCGTWVRQSP